MIILYFNDKYFMWAQPLIQSIAINEPSEKIVIFGLNLRSKQKAKLVRFRNVKQVVEIDNDLSRCPRKNGEAALLVGKKAWYLKKAIELFPKEKLFILMDVDVLLIKPLTRLKKQLKGHDMAGSFGQKEGTDGIMKVKIAGGFTAFKPTEIIKELLEEWNELLTTGPYYWNKDQPSLALLFLKHAKSIRFLDIDRLEYMDATLKKSSFLWSAHKSKYGVKEERHKVYLIKLQEMRKKK